ncbi:hypothetical protein ACEWY4_020908 [Coilia grayii]|uniref:DNA polymerase lambda fingers domain-containing protein n=1 Tax=Coilia grayii TaxID=363190 RepID=A0ABD1J7G4_9TELE
MDIFSTFPHHPPTSPPSNPTIPLPRQDAFEVLVEHADFCDSKGPALAFRRAASVLKSLPAALRCLRDTEELPCLGEQSRAVMETAEKWYVRGLRTLEEIVTQPHLHLNRMQQAGFLYYADISRGLSKAEAMAVGAIVEDTVHQIAPNASVVLTGGFRR